LLASADKAIGITASKPLAAIIDIARWLDTTGLLPMNSSAINFRDHT